jgi:hypothetical protein
LKPLAIVSEGDTCLKIEDTRDPVSSEEYDICGVYEFGMIPKLRYFITVNHSWLNLGECPSVQYRERQWIERLEFHHHFLSIENETEKLFRASGWEYRGGDWMYRFCDNTCERLGTSWVFWKSQQLYLDFGYDYEDQDIRTISYLKCDRTPLPRVETTLSREDWLKEIADCISSLSPLPPKRDASPKIDSSSKRRKVE